MDTTPLAKRPRQHFDHLDGFRTLATLAIALSHSEVAVGDFRWLLRRANAFVDYYIVLGGFLTAYAYGEADFSLATHDVARGQYFRKRFSRVGLTYYSALALAQLAQVHYGYRSGLSFRWGLLSAKGVFTLLMMQTVLDPVLMLSGGPFRVMWTISTLAGLWLLFPLLQPLLRRAGERSLCLLGLGAWVGGWALPALALATRSHALQTALHSHPLGWLGDFLLGAAGGVLLRRGFLCRWTGWAWACSAAIGAVLLATALPWTATPCLSPGEHLGLDFRCMETTVGGRWFFYHGMAPLYLLYMYGGCCRPDALAARLLSTSPMLSFGRISFQVYMFQTPVLHLVKLAEEAAAARSVGDEFGDVGRGAWTARLEGVYVLAFPICLWAVAAAFSHFIEEPLFARRPRKGTGAEALLPTSNSLHGGAIPATTLGPGGAARRRGTCSWGCCSLVAALAFWVAAVCLLPLATLDRFEPAWTALRATFDSALWRWPVDVWHWRSSLF